MLTVLSILNHTKALLNKRSISVNSVACHRWVGRKINEINSKCLWQTVIFKFYSHYLPLTVRLGVFSSSRKAIIEFNFNLCSANTASSARFLRGCYSEQRVRNSLHNRRLLYSSKVFLFFCVMWSDGAVSEHGKLVGWLPLKWQLLSPWLATAFNQSCKHQKAWKETRASNKQQNWTTQSPLRVTAIKNSTEKTTPKVQSLL